MKNLSNIKKSLGIIAFEMVDTIRSDIENVLKNETNENKELTRYMMNGYVLALSRILEKDVAWQCICSSYKKMNVEIPEEYYNVFGIVLEKK